MPIIYTIRGKCKSLKDVPKGAIVEEIDGRPVIGVCESCGIPITEAKSVKIYYDGVWECASCVKVDKT